MSDAVYVIDCPSVKMSDAVYVIDCPPILNFLQARCYFDGKGVILMSPGIINCVILLHFSQTERKTVVLCGFQPYTTHSFSVECRPGHLAAPHGFWSDPKRVDITTDEAGEIVRNISCTCTGVSLGIGTRS